MLAYSLYMETPFIHKEILPNKAYIIEKKVGETPLECLERFRDAKNAKIPMTYAGRLDPMASGKLIVLCGDECKRKETYLGLDKEYEVEILFGLETDTYDMLGMVTCVKNRTVEDVDVKKFDVKKYIGTFTQEYPAYSSKTVGGVQLHELSRKNELPEEMPTKEVEIYSFIEIERSQTSAKELLDRILKSIALVKGDFRQNEIKKRWKEVLTGEKFHKGHLFPILKIRVSCSSGTYMRSLANQIGKDVGTGAFALSIHRTKVGSY